MHLDEAEHLLAVLLGHRVARFDDAAAGDERLELGDRPPRSTHPTSVDSAPVIGHRLDHGDAVRVLHRAPWVGIPARGPRADVDLHPRVDIAFNGGVLLPLLGLILLPYTTLFYVLAYAPIAGVSSIGWFFVVLGFLLDLTSLFGGGREGRRYVS